MKLQLDITISKEAIEAFWEEHSYLRALDHKSLVHNPYDACIIREVAASLEWEDIGHVNEAMLVEEKS